MKKITKVNIMFTAIILMYLILIFTIRLIPLEYRPVNLMLILPEVWFLVVALLVCKILKSDAVKETEFRKVSIGTCFKSFILAFLCMPLVSLINLLSSLVNGNAVQGTMGVVKANPIWLNLLLIAALPAVVEEIIFRGLIFGTYKKRNPFKGMLLSALLFGLMHMNINQFSYAFALGAILAALYYATESIYPSIILHFTINATAVVLTYLTSGSSNTTKYSAEQQQMIDSYAAQGIDIEKISYVMAIAVLIMMAIAGVALGIVLFRSICKHNRGIRSFNLIFKKPMRSTYVAEGKFIDGYLILGMVLCGLYILYRDILVNFL